MARKMTVIIWHVLHDKQVYDPRNTCFTLLMLIIVPAIRLCD